MPLQAPQPRKHLSGAVGLIGNPISFRHWLVNGPKPRMIDEFVMSTKQFPWLQTSISEKVSLLFNVFSDMENPVVEHSGDPLTLDTSKPTKRVKNNVFPMLKTALCSDQNLFGNYTDK